MLIPPPDDQVKVKAGPFYDPALLPDYDPIVCQFQQAKLVQHDLFDIHGELIAPWNTANALRKGVVVATEARLLVYHFTENNPTSVCHFIVPIICLLWSNRLKQPVVEISTTGPDDSDLDRISRTQGHSGSCPQDAAPS